MALFESRLRLITGLIMAVFVSLHLLNHSLGLISLTVMEDTRAVISALWRNPLGAVLLYGAIISHFLMGLLAVYKRSTLKIPAGEILRIVLGLSVIPLLAGHVAGTFGGRYFLDSEITYKYVVKTISSNDWWNIRQTLLLLVVWIHVCLGLYFWLRIKRWFKKVVPVLYVIAVLIPVLAFLGFVRVAVDLNQLDSAATTNNNNVYSSGGRYDYGGASDKYGGADDSRYGYGSQVGLSGGSKIPATDIFQYSVLGVFYGLLALTLLARWCRLSMSRRRDGYEIVHPSGQKIRSRSGQTILEAIQEHAIPHASVCGGRARCTTCRVKVLKGLEDCNDPNDLEVEALLRIKADPNVRLACQTRPQSDIHIMPLVAPQISMSNTAKPNAVAGSEQEVVVMFVDLRDSTQLAEQHLPYDVLFILNRFFSEMSDAVAETHGHYAQFTGDGLIALYGLERGLESGCKDALSGSTRMLDKLQNMNEFFEIELSKPLKIGIGIHCGVAIVGTMGPPSSPNFTAIGDCVNTAARLESLCKEFQCVLVASTDVLDHAGLAVSEVDLHSVSVKGKSEPLEIATLNPQVVREL